MVYKIKGFKIAKRLKFTDMKNIVIFSTLLFCLFQINGVMAQDDVYDAPKSKQVKVKPTYSAPAEQTEKIIPVEKTQPYNEEGNTSSRMQSPSNDNNYIRNNDDYSDDYSADWGYGYSDRIRRFHNPSFQFNYGWNNWNNNFYDPWNSFNNNYGWNNWNSYAFTPSWTYGYNNFYNPFCNNTQFIIVQPGFNSWYNTGFNSPINNWNNVGWNSWNNFGFSPFCANTIYNNGFSNYEGFYDQQRKNVIYTPRTGGYNNTNNTTKSNNTNYNYNYPSNTNNGGFTKGTTNQQQVAPSKKWNNNTTNKTNTNSTPENNDVYRYNNQPANNNWNNSTAPSPSYNNNNNSGNGNSGIKIGTRPK